MTRGAGQGAEDRMRGTAHRPGDIHHGRPVGPVGDEQIAAVGGERVADGVPGHGDRPHHAGNEGGVRQDGDATADLIDERPSAV